MERKVRAFFVAIYVLLGVAAVGLFAVANPAKWARKESHPAVIWYVLAIGALVLVAIGAVNLLAGRLKAGRRLLSVVLNVLVVLGAVQLASWVLLRHTLLGEPERIEALLQNKMEGTVLGKAANDFRFRQHHYLNYVLEPALEGVEKTNPTHLIRRGEPIGPKKGPRVLVLGGSTTYDEYISEEKETWVYQLEKRVRARLGAAAEVINGGVPGYTLQENFIHYVTLLMHLQPDVVILFVGLNDVHPRLYSNLTYDYSNYRLVFRTRELPAPNPRLKEWQTYRLYYLYAHILGAARDGLTSHASPPYPAVASWPASIERNKPDIYRAKLDALVTLLAGQKIEVVIVPQFVNPTDRLVPFRAGVFEHNAVGAEIAKAHGQTFCSEMPETFPKNEVADECHFNAKGAMHMAEIVDACLTRAQLFEEAGP